MNIGAKFAGQNDYSGHLVIERVEREVTKEVGFACSPISQQEKGTRLGEKLALDAVHELADFGYRLTQTPVRGDVVIRISSRWFDRRRISSSDNWPAAASSKT